ncbi:MAG: hypothetical protein LBU81_02790 [Methanosarcinales archaeon]|jgi:hypothetical protein|nr:hypothetical protein [Methanosarcinales archaeon]
MPLFGARTNNKVNQKYTQTTTFAQWQQNGDGKVTDNTDYIKLIQMKTPAQSMLCFGTGGIVNGVDDRGVMQMILKDNASTPVTLNGVLRLYVTNAAFLDKRVIFEDRLERLQSSDIQSAFRLAETGLYAKEDSYLVMEFKADVSGKTISLANSSALIPITTLIL